jgi:hypothetical protein
MYLSASCRNVSEGPATWPPPCKAQQQGVQPTTFPSGKHKGEPDASVTIESNEGMSTPLEIHWRKLRQERWACPSSQTLTPSTSTNEPH